MMSSQKDVVATVVLASGSPRRRAFLEGAGVPHLVRAVDVDETPHSGEAPLAFACRMAFEKVQRAWQTRPPEEPPLILASDTVVTFDGRVLGKPADAEEAKAMLHALSGRSHEVITAWALASVTGIAVHSASTEVRFATLSTTEVDAYVATGDPLDKAGAYGIQGGAGRFVESVRGSYPAVVGLPIEPVLAALEAAGAVHNASDVERRARIVRARLSAAVSGNGRTLDDVTLVAVSKRQPDERLREGLACGLRTLGENYIQAWQARLAAFGSADVAWHFIGHLQRNKAKFLGEHVALVHGIDSLKTAAALAKVGRGTGRRLAYLVQVNLSGEASKSGVTPDGLGAFLDATASLEGAQVVGLMTVPPPAKHAAARRWFSQLRTLRDAHATPTMPLTELSMGMSGDYEEAVAEGATIIRVGTALYGGRAVG